MQREKNCYHKETLFKSQSRGKPYQGKQESEACDDTSGHQGEWSYL